MSAAMAFIRLTLSTLAKNRFGNRVLTKFSAPKPRNNMVNIVYFLHAYSLITKVIRYLIANLISILLAFQMLGFVGCNFMSTHRLSKNIELITEDTNVSVIKQSKKLITPNTNIDNRPLLVLLCWLLSKPNHIRKFVNFYMEQGFDVVTVSITPWQLMWPVKGSRVREFFILRKINIIQQNTT
jgi:hypothetical protein